MSLPTNPPSPDHPSRELVWHYTGRDALVNIVENHELWACSTSYMNDTAEVIHGSKMFRKLYDEARESLAEEARQRLEAWWFPATAEHAEPIPKFLFSASKDPDSLTMWRCYGQGGAGYAIGLDRTAGLSVLSKESDTSHPSVFAANRAPADVPDSGHPVSSDLETPFVEFLEWVDALYDQNEQMELFHVTLEDATTMLADPEQTGFGDTVTLLASSRQKQKAIRKIKHHGFEDEHEVRLVPSCGPAKKFFHFRSGRFGLTPHIKLTGTGPDNEPFVTRARPLPIRAIKVGPTAYPGPEVESIKGLLSMHGYQDVLVAASEIPFRQ